ncbi:MULTISPECIES: zinc ribbon domain-containing protein [unclassified Bacillus (in: firmicutes)]|uniref:zinc ribbon domain-containing protein n=1 Tax=unclassified Bacillus (in: firmicutes) TaxID=185979 RepID=UPI0022822214|nr:zinc ribbon domain-containing protein [Bacillus sp. S20C3]MCY8288685.1 zinc ribbon domain-containing protein [Bacillus sp. N13C7]MCY8636243.1 zinc ribbon domain-containing protein [Bacillus sp. S17B2]MCY9142306.1 zinc ribbon domain-containing protein [Bacillus sp. T9C1]
MYCPQCGHQTDGGKFCEKCGSPLPGQSGQQQAAQTGATAKQAAKQFGSFVLAVLKRPYQECRTTGGEQLISAVITMVLFSLLTPLMLYTLLSDGPGSVSFTAVFLEPTIYFALFLFGLHALIFFALKIAGNQVSFKDSFSRFGAFLIPFTAILIFALLLFLLHTDICFTVLAVGLIGAFFAIPPAMMSSYQHSYKGKADIIYSTIVIYLITCVTFQLMIEHYIKEIFRYMFF